MQRPPDGGLTSVRPAGGGGLTLPTADSMGALFARAFATEESLPGLARVMRDEEFVVALSRTSPFVTGDTNQDAVEVRRCLQALQRLTSSDSVRAAGNAVIGAVAELFARPELYRSVGGGDGGESQRGRAEILADYLSIIARQVQEGARVFGDRTLWAIIDDKITRIINPSLAQELGKIVSTPTVPATSVLTVYDLLSLCARTLEDASLSRDLRPLISLVASFSMERLAYALDQCPAVQITDSSQFGLKEQLAVRLATDLGGEVSQWGTARRAPQMAMFREAEGAGYAFLRSVFSGFFQLGSSVYRETPRNREDAARRDEVLLSYETLGACLGILWPAETTAMLRELMTGLDPFQKAAALKILKYTIADDSNAAAFTVAEAVRLLGHGDLRIFNAVGGVLADLAIPLAQWLSSGGGGTTDGATLIARQRDYLFERVFEPLAKANRLTPEFAQFLERYVVQLLERDGGAFLKNRPSLVRLISPRALAQLPLPQQQALTDCLVSAYGVASMATIDSEGLPNLDADREDCYAALLTGMGLSAVMRAFNWVSLRGLTEVGAAGCLAVRLLAARAAQGIAAERAAAHSAVEKKGYAAMVLRDLLPKLTEAVRHKQAFLLGATKENSKENSTPSGSAPTAPATGKPEHADDLSSLLKIGRRSASLEQSYPATLVVNPQFVCRLAELEGTTMRRAISAPVMPADTCADLLNYVGDPDLQLIMLQHEIGRRIGSTPGRSVPSIDQRLATLLTALASNAQRYGRAQQDEFHRLATFLVTGIEDGHFRYSESPEVVKALRGVLAKPLQQGLYGIRTSSESGAEMGVGLALRVFAAYAATDQPLPDADWRAWAASDKDRARNDPSPQRILRAVMQAWFKGFPPCDEHRMLMVVPRQIADVLRAMIPHEADATWSGQAVYLLAERLLSAVERYRGTPDDLRLQVEPLSRVLADLEAFVAPDFEAKDPQGETANVRSVTQRALAAARQSLGRPPTSGWHGSQERRVPQLAYQFRPGERLHIAGLDDSVLRLVQSTR